MIALLLAGCAWGPARVLADAEHADAFALQAHGHAIGGLALVSVSGGDVTLHALGPAGTDLFEVRVGAEGTAIDCPDPDLAGWLARIPFERDLTALYRVSCDDRCAYEDFRITKTGTGWRIRGPGGPATLREDLGRWFLDDPRRGYTLTVVPGDP